jgi:CheY-like chemotaxis protein
MPVPIQAADAVPAALPEAACLGRVLVVDKAAPALGSLDRQIRNLGYDVLAGAGTAAALDLLRAPSAAIDIILLDQPQPTADGIGLIRKLARDERWQAVPLIVLTEPLPAALHCQVLDAGAFYHLAKPVEVAVLRSVLGAARREIALRQQLSAALARYRTSFALLDTARFRFRTLPQAEDLAAFVAPCFAAPDRVLPGLAQLMINAVEHGLAGIGYDAKSDLLRQDRWRAEVERRLAEAPERQAELALARRPDGVYAVIGDGGPGFAWKDYLRLDPSRAGDSHGRGIAQANLLSFDRLAYNESGNQVVAFARHTAGPAWG